MPTCSDIFFRRPGCAFLFEKKERERAEATGGNANRSTFPRFSFHPRFFFLRLDGVPLCSAAWNRYVEEQKSPPPPLST